ncbi:OmpA family protein [Nitrospira sp. M1]
MMYVKQGLFTILSLGLVIVLMNGCSAKSQSRVMSEESDVAQLQEPVEPSESGISTSSVDSPVDPPSQSHEDEGLSQSIFASPQEGQGQLSDAFMPQEGSEVGQGNLPGGHGHDGSLAEVQLDEEPMEIAKLIPSEPEISSDERKEEVLHNLQDVFFDYDRFRLRADEFPELTTNAEVLASQLAGRTIVLQGHCDERGTESYNMILGKRRARAVRDYLVDLGVPGESLTVLSMGKEKPFCTEQTPECWQENRRVHFVIQ